MMMILSGCSGSPPTSESTNTATPRQSATDISSSPVDAAKNRTETPTIKTETAARGGLLTVEVVPNETTLNKSRTVEYNETVFNESPTLDGAVLEAVSTNATQTRDLSSQEVERIEAVADRYDKPTGGFVVVKNRTAVRISLGYEL